MGAIICRVIETVLTAIPFRATEILARIVAVGSEDFGNTAAFTTSSSKPRDSTHGGNKVSTSGGRAKTIGCTALPTGGPYGRREIDRSQQDAGKHQQSK